MNWFKNLFHNACWVEITYLKNAINHADNDLLRLRQDFEIRLAEKDAQIADTRRKLSLTEMELDQMRLVMMPLTSQAGAAYARSRKPILAPPLPTTPIHIEGISDWRGHLIEHMSTQDEIEKAASLAAKKEKDGT